MDVSEYWTRWLASQCKESQQKLFEHYWPLACSFALKVTAEGWPDECVDDALGYAAIGLSEALSVYRPDKGASFATYASMRVPGAVRDGLKKFYDLREEKTFNLDFDPVDMPSSGRVEDLHEEIQAILNESDYLIFKLRYIYKLKVDDAKHFVKGHNYRDLTVRLGHVREVIRNHLRFGYLREGDSYFTGKAPDPNGSP